jgi:hypothetical protein
MDRYNKFLSMGRENLEKFRDREEFVNSTGIEDSLVEPFLSQIIDLNKYISTTASTNYPNSLFQEMFVDGWIHKDYVTDGFLQKMNEMNYNYVITKEDTCCESQKSIALYENYFDKSNEHHILMDMLRAWWFDKSIIHPRGAFEEFIEFRNNYDNHLPEYFRSLYEDHNFSDCLQFLTDDHWRELENIRHTFPKIRGRDQYNLYKFHVGEVTNSINAGSSDYCCNVKDLIENGEILWIEIANYYDPTDRNLYKTLLNIFEYT